MIELPCGNLPKLCAHIETVYGLDVVPFSDAMAFKDVHKMNFKMEILGYFSEETMDSLMAKYPVTPEDSLIEMFDMCKNRTDSIFADVKLVIGHTFFITKPDENNNIAFLVLLQVETGEQNV